jgi:putative membrane protein insertion efficiency factor
MHNPKSNGLAHPNHLLARALFNLISIYKLLFSQLFTGSCRFVPSCSSYAQEALLKHGGLKGSWLTFLRLSRCHPLCNGGLDQVPKASRLQVR